jgi:hypothetical protein
MPWPNFLVIGVTKAGTTSLYYYLKQHPEIFMPNDIKEARFFCYDGKDTTLKIRIKTIKAYLELFDEVENEKAIGEASPHYFSTPHAAYKIKECLPDASLIASLRNPVERSFSTYIMNKREIGRNSDLTFLEALKVDPWLESNYHSSLERFFKLFHRNRLKIILFDDFTRNTISTLTSIFCFLEIDSSFIPDISQVHNPGGSPKIEIIHKTFMNESAREFGKRVLPDFLKKSFKRIYSKNLRREVLMADERMSALSFFRDDILRTQDLLNLDLTNWLSS